MKGHAFIIAGRESMQRDQLFFWRAGPDGFNFHTIGRCLLVVETVQRTIYVAFLNLIWLSSPGFTVINFDYDQEKGKKIKANNGLYIKRKKKT